MKLCHQEFELFLADKTFKQSNNLINRTNSIPKITIIIINKRFLLEIKIEKFKI